MKSYRFLSPSIKTTGRKIDIAAKAKAEGKKKKKKKKKQKKVGATVQKCMGGAATKNAKTFSLVLNTLNGIPVGSCQPLGHNIPGNVQDFPAWKIVLGSGNCQQSGRWAAPTSRPQLQGLTSTAPYPFPDS